MSLRLIALFLALAWGLNWPAVKIALSEIPPFTLRAIGLGSGAALLLILAAARRVSLLPPRASWPGVLLGGVLSVAVFNLCTAMAQLATSTSRAAVLTFTMPLMSALLAWWWLGERPDRRRAQALALGALGIGLLAWPVLNGLVGASSGAGGPGLHGWRGLLYPLTAAAGWAAGTVLSKRWPVSGDRLVVTAWQLVVGALAGALGAWWLHEPWPPWPPSLRVGVALAFHIGPATALAYWAWFILVERVSAITSSLTSLAVPVVGVLGAMALVGDRPGWLDAAGFACVLGGAALTLLQLGRPTVR